VWAAVQRPHVAPQHVAIRHHIAVGRIRLSILLPNPRLKCLGMKPKAVLLKRLDRRALTRKVLHSADLVVTPVPLLDPRPGAYTRSQFSSTWALPYNSTYLMTVSWSCSS